ncbi:hypothetical protein JOC78_000829 [Bacillus ectoiniformans]|uniref:hypothetical protein n=1 Tax=Bacillus ectoiniformans TaxID=1494429 RepID=UPI0019564CE5|nr:hypothetical protein [Bacillus ectoiniformans]MBM7647889.1 hypothetical protein [Bacillus ectoiniformans]
MSDSQLVDAYQRLWKNRTQGEIKEEEAAITLKTLIQRELLDEYTHPRARRSKEEKFYFASKRILESNLDSSIQIQLLNGFLAEMERIKNE